MQLLSWKRRESTRTKLLSLEGEAPHHATRALQSATTAANTEPEEPGRNNTLQSPGISGCTPSLSGGVWDRPPQPDWMCSYSWTLESRGPKPMSRVMCSIYGGVWRVLHQLSAMPGAVGPQSIQAGNFHFSTEAAEVNVPQRAVTAPVLPHLTCTSFSLHCSELQSATPQRSQGRQCHAQQQHHSLCPPDFNRPL